MNLENSKPRLARLSLSDRLELFSLTENEAFMTNLSVDDALELAQQLVLVVAHLKPAGEGEQSDKVQDALSQGWTWLGIAMAGVQASRVATNPNVN